jgi:hypothetical protein
MRHDLTSLCIYIPEAFHNKSAKQLGTANGRRPYAGCCTAGKIDRAIPLMSVDIARSRDEVRPELPRSA